MYNSVPHLLHCLAAGALNNQTVFWFAIPRRRWWSCKTLIAESGFTEFWSYGSPCKGDHHVRVHNSVI